MIVIFVRIDNIFQRINVKIKFSIFIRTFCSLMDIEIKFIELFNPQKYPLALFNLLKYQNLKKNCSFSFFLLTKKTTKESNLHWQTFACSISKYQYTNHLKKYVPLKDVQDKKKYCQSTFKITTYPLVIMSSCFTSNKSYTSCKTNRI